MHRRWLALLAPLLCPACGSADGVGGDSSTTSSAASEAGGSTSAAVDDTGHGPETHGDTTTGSDGDTTDGGPHGDGGPPPDGLPYDPDQLAEVCARGNGDPIALDLCTDPPPTITSLTDLYQAIDVVIEPASMAALANSTSLAARSVSAVNPRVFARISPGEGIDVELGAAAFSRGEQVVELVGYDPANDSLNFYLLTFFQACNDSDTGCSAADRFTPAIESGWTKWSLYQDVDLANHVLDCNTCHQPGGPGTPKLLLMQQAEDPWMHWFAGFSLNTGGLPTTSAELLTPLFLEMHGTEPSYGGVPMALFTQEPALPSGIVMRQMLDIYWSVKGGAPAPLTVAGQEQPFDSIAIEADVAGGSTSTWDEYHAASLAGERLPPPWHHHDITDADARAEAVASYLAVIAGEAAPDTLIPPVELVSDQTAAELGFRPRADASAEEILHHVCQRCHNGRLDQSLTRARFDASDPAALTAEQKASALARIMLADDEPGHMPPARFASLPEDARTRLAEFLSQ